MFSPSEVRGFREMIQEISSELPNTPDEDARLVIGMVVSISFNEWGKMTPEVNDIVELYKKLKPHLAAQMDAFVASGGNTELL